MTAETPVSIHCRIKVTCSGSSGTSPGDLARPTSGGILSFGVSPVRKKSSALSMQASEQRSAHMQVSMSKQYNRGEWFCRTNCVQWSQSFCERAIAEPSFLLLHFIGCLRGAAEARNGMARLTTRRPRKASRPPIIAATKSVATNARVSSCLLPNGRT